MNPATQVSALKSYTYGEDEVAFEAHVVWASNSKVRPVCAAIGHWGPALSHKLPGHVYGTGTAP